MCSRKSSETNAEPGPVIRLSGDSINLEGGVEHRVEFRSNKLDDFYMDEVLCQRLFRAMGLGHVVAQMVTLVNGRHHTTVDALEHALNEARLTDFETFGDMCAALAFTKQIAEWRQSRTNNITVCW